MIPSPFLQPSSTPLYLDVTIGRTTRTILLLASLFLSLSLPRSLSLSSSPRLGLSTNVVAHRQRDHENISRASGIRAVRTLVRSRSLLPSPSLSSHFQIFEQRNLADYLTTICHMCVYTYIYIFSIRQVEAFASVRSPSHNSSSLRRGEKVRI